MDLKDQMRKAELNLQKTVAEKDKLQRQKNSQSYKIQDLDDQLAKRDHEAVKRDDIYRDLQKKFEQQDIQHRQIVGQTSSHLNEL